MYSHEWNLSRTITQKIAKKREDVRTGMGTGIDREKLHQMFNSSSICREKKKLLEIANYCKNSDVWRFNVFFPLVSLLWEWDLQNGTQFCTNLFVLFLYKNDAKYKTNREEFCVFFSILAFWADWKRSHVTKSRVHFLAISIYNLSYAYPNKIDSQI